MQVVPISRDYSGIRAAINTVASQGGGTVVLESADYVDDGTGTIVIPTNNIHIQGQGRTRIIAPKEGAVNILSCNYTRYNPVNLTQNVPENGTTLSVSDPTYFKVGSYVLIIKPVRPDVIEWSLICFIRAIAGNVLTITPFVPFAIETADNYTICPIDLLKGIAVRNIEFDGNNNSDQCRAMTMFGTQNGVFKDLTFVNFLGAAAFLAEMGFGNMVDNHYVQNSGSMNECDWKFSYQTNGQVNMVRSVSASGFGPQYIRCNFCTSTNINILSAAGRGLKLNGTLYCVFANVISHDNGSVGIALCYGSAHNQFTNCSVVHHQGHNPDNSNGIWTTGDYNTYNLVTNSVFFDSLTKDIFIDPADHNNVVVDSEYDTTWVGCCSGNCTNKIYPSVEKCWILRMWEYCFGCCCSNRGCCCCDPWCDDL